MTITTQGSTGTGSRRRPGRAGAGAAAPHANAVRRGSAAIRTGRRSAALTAAMVFFFGPAAAYAVGVRPEPIDNRPLAAFPSPLAGWGFFPAFERWSTDHLPLRDAAVRANTGLSTRLFGQAPDYGSSRGPAGAVPGLFGEADGAPPGPDGATGPDGAGGTSGAGASGPAGDGEDGAQAAPAASPYPRVIPGREGWLYSGDDVALPCRPELDLDATLAGWRRLISVLTRSGRRVVVTVAPDKSTVVPEHLPERYRGQQCSAERREQLWQRLGSGELGPAYLDLRASLERQQALDGMPIYWPGDTHWRPRGEVLFAQDVARRIAPGLVASADARDEGPDEVDLDLPKLLGTPRTDTAPGWRVRREGVSSKLTTDKQARTLLARYTSRSTGSELVRTPTVLVGDSFSYRSVRNLAPYFATLTFAHRKRLPAADRIREIQNAGIVVLEVVERHFTSSTSGLIDAGFVDELERQLRSTGPPAAG